MKNTTRPVDRFQSPLTPQACSYRKISKPLMEKKRRARINECLEQLKTLLEEHYSNNIRKRKLEKADILELTVKHLRDLQGSRKGVLMLTQEGVAEYQAGFRSCLNGVSQYLLRSKGTDEHLRLGMLNHLVNAFPVFSGCRFSTADSGGRLEAVPSPRARLAGFQPASAPRVDSPVNNPPLSPAGNSSPGTPVAENRPNGQKADTVSAQDQCPPCIIAQSKCPAKNTLDPASECLWRPW
ncbi:transcription factor HES-3-like [Scyliorhinus canicula]|uniref:transcription factor HES-3-like n=1 Tax=Scyliorhinus canicula TaxID=7830 RepID=UPI0018F6833F|nr:transcription factor HES-3-like [Scyliorhinus canicula]